ncbi:hypothetical protein [Nonomuraea dietziae]|uniref:hypothetical protein n=1 Tax=Nonomuraea dietziae TaxID=65515 RepID=UPI0031DF1220
MTAPAQVDTLRSSNAHWGELQDYASAVRTELGPRIDIPPRRSPSHAGAEEVIARLALREQARSGHWDVIVVDCALPPRRRPAPCCLAEALDWHVLRAACSCRGRRLIDDRLAFVRSVAHVSTPARR